MGPRGPSTLHWKPNSRTCFPAVPVGCGDHCRLLHVTCFVEILVRSEMVKQKVGEAAFCTWSRCFDLQPVLPAVERKHHLMSPLCMYPEITLWPDHWSKLSYVWAASRPQYWVCSHHPQMFVEEYTPQSLWDWVFGDWLLHALKQQNSYSINLT